MNLGRSDLQTQLTAWLMRRTPSMGIRRVAPIAAALATDVGAIRQENQDRVAIARGRDLLGRPFAIVALADGIGGMRNGAECAALALGSLFNTVASEAMASIDSQQWLHLGIHQANNAVHARMLGEGGATIAAALISGNGMVHWASVGDSRIYSTDGTALKQLSVDDTIAGQLGRHGEAGFEQSKLIQFIGIGKPLEVSVSELPIAAGATILLTTDGVHFLDSSPWFDQLIKHSHDPGVCVRRLIDLSRWCGGPDNATAAMLSLGNSIDDGAPDIYGCLEVWDPFGELQVICIPQKQLRASVAINTMTPSSDDTLTPEVEAAACAEPPQQDKAGSTTKKRSPRKSKSTTKIQRAEESPEKVSAPQLLIEFPNKTNS